MAKKLRKSARCLNCHHEIGEHNYCPNCGQMNTTKNVPIRDFFKDFIDDVFTIDSKLLRSFKPLLFKPGFLTNEYINGKRVSYILPLRLYFFITILFFTTISVQNSLFLDEEKNTEDEEDKTELYFQRFKEAIAPQLGEDSLKIKLISYELSSKFRIKDRLKRYSKFHRAFKEKLGIAYSDTGYMKLLSKVTLREKNGSKSSRLLLKKRLEKIGVDTVQSNKISRELNKQFKLETSYYKSDWKAQKKLKTHLKNEFSLSPLKQDSIYAAIVIPHRLSLSTDANFTLYSGSIVEDLSVDTVRPSFFEKMLIRFEEKSKSISKLGSAAFGKEVVDQIPTIMFIMLPIFALLYKLLYIRRNIVYVNHLIFSLHAHSIFFLYILFAVLWNAWYIVLFSILGIFVHWYLSMKCVYGQSHPKTIMKFLLVFVSYFFCLIFGGIILIILSVITI
jgi:hypothetical protein